jgi:hypothetical protein
MWAFKQSSLYQTYLNGGPLAKVSNRNELLLHRTREFGDLLLIYIEFFLCITWTLHLEGQEVFESHKWRTNLPLRLERDSHKHDHVNFFHLQVDANSTSIAIGACDDGHLPITRTNCGIPILMHIGGEICEIICERGVWHIECWTPKSSSLNAMFCKRTPTLSAKWKSYHRKHLLVFLFHVMMVGGIILKVVFDNDTYFGSIVMIWIIKFWK